MTGIAFALAVALQDGGRLLEDAVDKLREAKGVALEGSLKRTGEDTGPEMRFLAGGLQGAAESMRPFEGTFTARLGEEDAAIRATNAEKKCDVEVYRRGEKVVKRQTWTKEKPDADPFADELLRALDWNALKGALSDAKFEETSEEAGEKLVKGELPARLFEAPEPDPDENAHPWARMFRPKVAKVAVHARIDAESGELKSVSFEVLREINFGNLPGMVFRFGGGDPPPDDEEGGGEAPRLAWKTSVSFKVTGTGEEHAPKIPKEVEEKLKE